MRHVLLAFTNPVEGGEDEFNAWYDDFHLREVVQYGTGMRGGQRFRLSAVQRPRQAQSPWSYMAWYDFEHSDLAEFHRSPWAIPKPPLKAFTGIVADGHAAWVYRPIGERIGRPAQAAQETAEARFLFMAFTNPAADRDDVFNDWYDRQHIPEILASLPGFVSARRYVAGAHQRTGQPPVLWRYLAVYEVEAASAAAVQLAASGTAALTPPPEGTLDPDHVAWVFEPLGGYIDGSTLPATEADMAGGGRA